MHMAQGAPGPSLPSPSTRNPHKPSIARQTRLNPGRGVVGWRGGVRRAHAYRWRSVQLSRDDSPALRVRTWWVMHPSSASQPQPQLLALSGSSQPPLLLLLHCMPPAVVTAAAADAEAELDAAALGVCCMT